MFTKITRFGLALALGAGLVAGGAAVPAQAKTVKACVNKSTGELRILTGSKKKCKKGWKKISWNKKGATGPQGNPGAQGPNLVVKDATGKVLGKFLGVLPQGLSFLAVEIDGGVYTYMASGLLYPSFMSGSPDFKNNTCTGTSYITSSSPTNTQFLTGSAGGPTRLVYRKTDPAYGPALAWEFTTTTENVVAPQQLYRLNATGTCAADGAPYTGTLVQVNPVAAPPDVTGPLTIG